MTRETAKKLLPIIQAFSEEQAIQYRESPKAEWVDCKMPDSVLIFYDDFEYRIKPKPREWWIGLAPLSSADVAYRTETGNTIKVQEVVDE
jgi:hypothetical protein